MGENKKLVEDLAALSHDQWAGWMTYLFKMSFINNITGDCVIPSGLVLRWKRQSCTAYKNLPENEKESDRKEARRMIDVAAKRGVFDESSN